MQGGAVGLKSYLTVVEIHRAAIIRALTSPVAANRLAAGAFFFGGNDHPRIWQALLLIGILPQALFFVKMATLDLTGPVAERYLAAGASFFG